MDFELPEEILMIKKTIRQFIDREVIPLERDYRPEGEDMPERLLKPLQEKAKALGFWHLDVPQEYGGAGLDLLTRCVIAEEVFRTVALPFRNNELFGPVVRPVLFYCNEEQKKRFLFPVLRGEMRVCFAQTEPDAGSDSVVGIINHHIQGPLGDPQSPCPVPPDASFLYPLLR